MNLNQLDYSVIFYAIVNEGPEAGMYERQDLYSCFAGLYEPTQKDVQLGNLELLNNSVTLNIRNPLPVFVPAVHHFFEIENGLYTGMKFNIKNVSPAKTDGYIKIVGEEQ